MIKSLVGEKSLIIRVRLKKKTDEKKAFEHSHARYIRFNKHPLPVVFTIYTTLCNIITGVFLSKVYVHSFS